MTNSDAATAIALRRSGSLTDLVHTELERLILAGELKAGERLNEQALAARLGVSRGPIREATRALERSGLVVAIANRGVFVRQIGVQEIAEIYDVRSLMFGLACSRLARRLEPEQAAALRELVAAMEADIARRDPSGYYQRNLAFHEAVMTFAGHEKARQTYAALSKELHLTRQRSLLDPTRMRQSNGEHAAIVEALAAGDGELCRRLGEAHAQGGKRRWLEVLSE